jgi:HAD superfamily hydrolase (TIGR01490 family)
MAKDESTSTEEAERSAEHTAETLDRAERGEHGERGGQVAAAFFDLDKTLIPGSSLFLLARGLYARDLFRVRDLLGFGWAQARYRMFGERPEGVDLSRNATLQFVRGRSRDELSEWGREIAEERILPRVYSDAVALIDGHRSHGHRTYLVTAAPIELAEMVAQALGMTGAVATVSELDDEGRYTGRLLGPVVHGEDKAKAVAEIAERDGIDLHVSAAYSDSVNDLPLLEMVGFPQAVNPEPELRRLARSRGWPIHLARPRRHALLVGIPAGLGGLGVFGAGVSLGVYLERRANKRRGRSLGRIVVAPDPTRR